MKIGFEELAWNGLLKTGKPVPGFTKIDSGHVAYCLGPPVPPLAPLVPVYF